MISNAKRDKEIAKKATLLKKGFDSLKIPLPPLIVQQEAVKDFKLYERMITAQSETINFFQEKCQERPKALWG